MILQLMLDPTCNSDQIAVAMRFKRANRPNLCVPNCEPSIEVPYRAVIVRRYVLFPVVAHQGNRRTGLQSGQGRQIRCADIASRIEIEKRPAREPEAVLLDRRTERRFAFDVRARQFSSVPASLPVMAEESASPREPDQGITDRKSGS